MKARNADYDKWMRLKNAVEPPETDNDADWERYYECRYRMQFLAGDGHVIAEADYYNGAEEMEIFESAVEDMMEHIRENDPDEFDYSDPTDPASVYFARRSEALANLASVMDLINSESKARKSINWGDVGSMNHLVELSERIAQEFDDCLTTE